jgi:hypothetical protein
MRLQLYRPTRTADSSGGGFTTTLGTATEIWGWVTIHETGPMLSYQHGTDLEPEDLIDAGGAYYRVVSLVGATGAPWQRAILERRDRPITP